MKIRKAKTDDVSRILYLFRNTVRKINSLDYSEEQIRAWIGMNSASKYKKMINDGGRYLLLAENASGLLGMAIANFEKNKITGLYTRAGNLKQGIGARLLARIEQAMKKAGAENIVLDSTITAKGFYLKNGYKALRKKTVVFNNIGLPVISMKKLLK